MIPRGINKTSKITYKYSSAKFYAPFLIATLIFLTASIGAFAEYYYDSTKVNLNTYMPANFAEFGFQAISQNGNQINQITNLDSAYSKISNNDFRFALMSPAVVLNRPSITEGNLYSVSGSAIWKVYWNPTTQTQLTIALQWQPTITSAINSVHTVGNQLQNPAQLNLNYGSKSYTSNSTINGSIPNSVTRLWVGTTKVSNTKYDFITYVSVFNVDQKVAAVALTQFRSSSLGKSAMFGFARQEYNLLNTDQYIIYVYAGVLFLILTLTFYMTSLIFRRRRGTRYMFVDNFINSDIDDDEDTNSQETEGTTPAISIDSKDPIDTRRS